MTTIFAPITSLSASSVILLRISGEKAIDCLQKLGFKAQLAPNQVQFGNIHDQNGEILDQAVVTYFKAPHSFTGEDVVEISLHGSSYIYSQVSAILLEITDVKLAEAGEFSKRAFLNNKFDLVQAEAIVDLVNCQTQLQHKQALKQLQGNLGKIYDDWRGQIVNILALIESFIDFPDEDIPEDVITQVRANVLSLTDQIKSHLDDNKKGQKVHDGLKMAIIGAPNVGKSSLLNFLAQSEVAIVSDIAGTTRDIIDVSLDIAGVPVKISDTAGIRASKDVIEQEGIKRAINKAQDCDIIIILSDLAHQNDEISNYINEKISQIEDLSEKSVIRLFNKLDLKDNADKEDCDLEISLKEQQNLDQLLDLIEVKVQELIPDLNETLITKQRYRDNLTEALEYLQEFNLDKNIEIAGEDLRIAGTAIGKITGKIEVDNILDVIFSKFCIGK